MTTLDQLLEQFEKEFVYERIEGLDSWKESPDEAIDWLRTHNLITRKTYKMGEEGYDFSKEIARIKICSDCLREYERRYDEAIQKMHLSFLNKEK